MTSPDPDDFVPFRTLATHGEAEVVLALLRASDIPAYIPGEELQDAYATALKTENLAGCTIHVPRVRLPDAERVFDESVAIGDQFNEGDGGGDDE